MWAVGNFSMSKDPLQPICSKRKSTKNPTSIPIFIAGKVIGIRQYSWKDSFFVFPNINRITKYKWNIWIQKKIILFPWWFFNIDFDNQGGFDIVLMLKKKISRLREMLSYERIYSNRQEENLLIIIYENVCFNIFGFMLVFSW